MRWKECASNLASALSYAFHHPTLNDVKLVASEDGQLFHANPMVLASASPLLKSLLLEASDSDEPVILLVGVRGATVHDLLRFVYYGEVRLGPSRLAPLLSLANDLGIDAIKGLNAELRTDDTESSHALGLGAFQATPAVTGLSLLASAALKAEDPSPYSQPAQLHVEASNPSIALHAGAMNLSIKDEYNGKTNSNKVLYPLLNIPDPSHFKWKRAFMRVSPSSSENGDKVDLSVEERLDESPPPLAIDMSSHRADPHSIADLPATPSPSPSSLVGTSCFSEQAMPMEENQTSPILVLPEAYEESSVRHAAPRASSQSSNGEGKRWKSRQPKLCIHCDRYFSNQFNLKQVRHCSSCPKF